MVRVLSDVDSGMFSMFGRTKPHKRGSHRPENVGQQCDNFWPVGSPYGVLQHLKAHLVHHGILWPGGSVRNLKFMTLLTDIYIYFMVS